MLLIHAKPSLLKTKSNHRSHLHWYPCCCSEILRSLIKLERRQIERQIDSPAFIRQLQDLGVLLVEHFFHFFSPSPLSLFESSSQYSIIRFQYYFISQILSPLYSRKYLCCIYADPSSKENQEIIMAGGEGSAASRSLQETPTWALATVCFFFIFLGIGIEHMIHLIGHVRV